MEQWFLALVFYTQLLGESSWSIVLAISLTKSYNGFLIAYLVKSKLFRLAFRPPIPTALPPSSSSRPTLQLNRPTCWVWICDFSTSKIWASLNTLSLIYPHGETSPCQNCHALSPHLYGYMALNFFLLWLFLEFLPAFQMFVPKGNMFFTHLAAINRYNNFVPLRLAWILFSYTYPLLLSWKKKRYQSVEVADLTGRREDSSAFSATGGMVESVWSRRSWQRERCFIFSFPSALVEVQFCIAWWV